MRLSVLWALLGLAALLLGCSDDSNDGSGPGPLPERDSILTLAPADTALLIDQTLELNAVLQDPDSQPISSFSISYLSLAPDIASVTPGGVVTGLSSGRTSIIGSVGGAADTVSVTVPLSFKSVDAGFSTCGTLLDGEGRCWGFNHQGELGSGAIGLATPGPVTPVGGLLFFQIHTSPGSDSTFSCGLTHDSAIYCWGNNVNGQLGTGDQVSSPSPRRVLGQEIYVDLDVGAAHACGLTEDGSLFCWGSNASGQLGTGDSTDSNQPVPVQTSLRFSSVSLGAAHSCAIGAGTPEAYCWGDNTYGQLGTGITVGSPVPAPLAVDLQFTGGFDAGVAHTCGIIGTGDAYCWGYNIYGEVGTGRFVFEPVLSPSLVVGEHSWQLISAGSGFTCGITAEGKTYCWGIDADGRLGIGAVGTPNQHPIPELVAGNQVFTDISAGYDQTCAIANVPGGPLYCWGRNNRGQLDGYPGDFMTAASYTPRLVTGF